MRRLLLPAILAVLISAPASAAPEPPRAEGKEARPAPRRAPTLDELYARLAASGDDAEARGVAGLIERRLARSGSDTADLLATRAGEALRAKDYPLAIELLDRVVAMEPGWADAWAKRAAAFQLLDDPVSAMADLRQAIGREPRHFLAWAALGRLYAANDDDARALEAYRRALAIHPRLPAARAAVEHLAPEIDGRDL
jgi:tetratricopeptide (TPR) repeat protein